MRVQHIVVQGAKMDEAVVRLKRIWFPGKVILI